MSYTIKPPRPQDRIVLPLEGGQTVEGLVETVVELPELVVVAVRIDGGHVKTLVLTRMSRAFTCIDDELDASTGV